MYESIFQILNMIELMSTSYVKDSRVTLLPSVSSNCLFILATLVYFGFRIWILKDDEFGLNMGLLNSIVLLSLFAIVSSKSIRANDPIYGQPEQVHISYGRM